MSTSRTTDAGRPAPLRDFAEPPTKTKRLIETVAIYVAQHGAQSEFRLRSKQKTCEEYSFLYLDDHYAPFYQVKLKEARDALLVALSTGHEAPSAHLGTNNQPYLVRTGYAENPGSHTTTSDDPTLFLGPRNMQQMQNVQSHQTRQNNTSTPSRSSHISSDQDLNMADRTRNYKEPTRMPPQAPGQDERLQQNESQNAQATDCEVVQHPNPNYVSRGTQTRPLPTPVPQPTLPVSQRLFPQGVSMRVIRPPLPSGGVIPYGVLQEVFLLDNEGTTHDNPKPPTYIILTNTPPTEIGQNPLEQALFTPQVPVHYEPIYTIRPASNTAVSFPQLHSKLLPTGFAVGQEVQHISRCGTAVVMRRYVVGGKRLYDLRDECGIDHAEVKEELLVERR